LRGPTSDEQENGLTSWFSSATAGALRSVSITDGVARVDLDDFSGTIAGASTSCGSNMLLRQLNRTATQFPTVHQAIYSFEGDVDAFYAWLQGSPPAITRYRDSSSWDQSVDVDHETGEVGAAGFNEMIDREQPRWAISQQDAAAVLLHLDQEEKLGATVELSEDRDPESRPLIVVTISDLPDDSVGAIRYELVLTKGGDGLFRLLSGSWAQRCQPGRGHQTFDTSLCL
jgi:hypothetical protein